MKTLACTLAASAACFATPAYAADMHAPSCSGDKPALAATYPMDATQFDKFEGSYRLSDGKVIALAGRDGRFYARLGERDTEIVPVASNAFVSRDARLSIDFDSTVRRGPAIRVVKRG